MQNQDRSAVYGVRKVKVKRTKRTDAILLLKQEYEGSLDSPRKYNAAFAEVLHLMADKNATIGDAYVDPEIVIWMHESGKIQAQAVLSPKE